MSQPIALSRRAFILSSLALAACKPGENVLKFAGLTMGTTYNVIARDPSGTVVQADAQAQIDAALNGVIAQMSNWDSSSEISKFNAQRSTDTFSMSPDLANVMAAASDVNIASEGRFDTTMGPLIEAWGFGANGDMSKPTNAQIADAQARSGHSATLTVNGNGMQKILPETQVYLAAIGKGYGADKVGQVLENLGINNYMVEIGGDLYAAGTNADGQPWQIGIEKPAALSGGVMDVVGVSGMGLASSGDYRNYFEQDGVRNSHVIDPTTGRPITHTTASATVLAENAMLADAWATAMLILGKDRGLVIADQNDIAVVFIERDPNAADLQFTSSASAKFAALTA